jgi:RNA polymerase sporulation-specific sigma factor
MENNLELVIQAKNGNQFAFTNLYEKYQPLLVSMASKYSSMCKEENGQMDDFLQKANIALNDAIKTYNVDNGKVTFGAYARTVVRNRLVSMVRHMKSKKRKKSDLNSSCESVTPQDRAVWREHSVKLSEKAERVLSPFEKRVFHLLPLFSKGNRAREISLRVNKSEKSVNNAIFRIRSKLMGDY